MSPAVRDLPALVCAVVVLLVGTLLALDALDVLHLGLGLVGPLFLAAVGAILLAVGLDGRRRGEAPPA